MLSSLKSFLRLQRVRLQLRAFDKAIDSSDCSLVVLYTMGKVGSSSIYNGLTSSPYRKRKLHLHFLCDLYRPALDEHIKYFPHSTMPAHFLYSDYIRTNIEKLQGRLKFISLVRDPVAFALSDIFQNPYFFGIDNKFLTKKYACPFQRESLLRAISDILIHNHSLFNYFPSYIDSELNAFFQADLLSLPFDYSTGCEIYDFSNFPSQLFICQLEQLSYLESSLSSFLGISHFKLKPSNQRSRVNPNYQYVKENLSLPISVLDKIYSQPAVKHFYSPDQIEAFKVKYLGQR